jgi:hypothetical protein
MVINASFNLSRHIKSVWSDRSGGAYTKQINRANECCCSYSINVKDWMNENAEALQYLEKMDEGNEAERRTRLCQQVAYRLQLKTVAQG